MSRAGTLRLALALGLAAGLAAGPAGARPTVILLAWDGLRHDHPDRAPLPALARMERGGVRAERLVPPFPPNTFPALVTLATGTHPDRHGIVDNRFRDAQRGLFDYSNDASWIEAEPLWVAAERQGVRSAVFFWVGSETDWRGRGPSYRRAPFDSDVPEKDKVDQILAWLDLPEPERPHLVLSWWHGSDRAGHRRGPEHAAVSAALAGQDAELGRLLAGLDARGLWERTTLLVVGDHGMARVRLVLDPEAALARAGIAARVLSGGGVAHVHLERPEDLAAARRALSALPGVSAETPAELPARLRAARADRMGDLVLRTAPPAVFRRSGSRGRRLLETAASWLGRGRGAHGYDPDLPEMGAALLALGRGAPAGARLPAVHAIDVAPTVAALLGIEAPADSEGTARLPLVAPAAP